MSQLMVHSLCSKIHTWNFLLRAPLTLPDTRSFLPDPPLDILIYPIEHHRILAAIVSIGVGLRHHTSAEHAGHGVPEIKIMSWKH